MFFENYNGVLYFEIFPYSKNIEFSKLRKLFIGFGLVSSYFMFRFKSWDVLGYISALSLPRPVNMGATASVKLKKVIL